VPQYISKATRPAGGYAERLTSLLRGALSVGGELGDRREPALGAHALTRCAALGLGLSHFEHGSPAEVAALRALGGLEVVELVTACHTGGAALEALDYEGIHTP
jgi:hypothetical protein